MRTTIDLPDELFRKVKAVASLKGITLKQFITRAVRRELSSNNLPVKSQRIHLPLVPSKSPGSVALSAERISQILDQEDLDVPS
ncbi:MAG: hypothetical protein JSV89_11825 [Spirochaetaceae bacterium]|nr:MAG: hypothetical protein JSV89_11825 [Spirochaetaceae bacterium]